MWRPVLGEPPLVRQDRPVPGAVDPDDLTAELRSLVERGPRSRAALIRLADRGDWRTRVLALSALGCLIRRDPIAHRPSSVVGNVLARVPGVRRHLPTVGRYGRLVSPSLLNAVAAPAFLERTAAALALGECRDPALAPVFTRLLDDPFRPVRLAAAFGLAALGHEPRHDDAAGGGAGEPTPAVIADGDPVLEWLTRLAEAHRSLFEPGQRLHGLGTTPRPAMVAEWLAGPLANSGGGGATAEAQRYEHETDLAHQLAKPFGSHDRADNLRQLDAFIALVAQLDLPRGARIVDLGGGSGWVSDLLARFGFRPVLVDVARSLLQLSAQRLHIHELAGHVVAADMTALPFTSGAVDAVIVVDALHHVDDVEAVLQEARRVLVPGGPLLIGEPGEGHAESAKSLAEGREQGVRESEVHPLTIGRLAARAGFDRVDILLRVPASAAMRVSDLRGAMRAPVDSWPVQVRGTVARFDALVLRSMLARPLMVLSAGRRRPDSRAPGALLARIRPEVRRNGPAVVVAAEIENTGDTDWWTAGSGQAGAVSLGLQLLAADGRMLNRELARAPLPAPVTPGGRCRVELRATLPDGGPFRLKLDLVADGVCWFEDRGSRPVTVDA
jgi:SAM-dependent methyltransferase